MSHLNKPKIGIRPIIDGRRKGIRESLETTTMNMARNVTQLYSQTLRYSDSSLKVCVVADTCLGGVKEAACYADEQIFRPAVWAAYGPDDEGAGYRACSTYGTLYN